MRARRRDTPIAAGTAAVHGLTDAEATDETTPQPTTPGWPRRSAAGGPGKIPDEVRHREKWRQALLQHRRHRRGATDHQGLNFIVEHAGIPRIEDFCYMAVQEPNVYAGLSVVIGALMHSRPKSFAKMIGELLFWVGEDKMTYGGDYNIWTPQWQVEGFVDWEMPDDDAFTDYPRLTTEGKKKILGLNAARLYDIPVPPECQLADPDAAGDSDRPGGELINETAGSQA